MAAVVAVGLGVSDAANCVVDLGDVAVGVISIVGDAALVADAAEAADAEGTGVVLELNVFAAVGVADGGEAVERIVVVCDGQAAGVGGAFKVIVLVVGVVNRTPVESGFADGSAQGIGGVFGGGAVGGDDRFEIAVVLVVVAITGAAVQRVDALLNAVAGVVHEAGDIAVGVAESGRIAGAVVVDAGNGVELLFVRSNLLRQPAQGIEGSIDGGDQTAIGIADVAADAVAGCIVAVVYALAQRVFDAGQPS